MLNPGLHSNPGPQNGSYIPIPKGLKPIIPIPNGFIPIIPIPKGLYPKLNAELPHPELPHPELKFETRKLL
ncbi:MAG: hypothetical protein RLZZ207_732 [Bacteroidota bacterium]